MAQRPIVRTDSSEQRGHADEPPPVDATHSKQRPHQGFEPLAIRVSGAGSEVSSSDPNLDQVLKLIADQACLATSATASAIALQQHDEIICRATSGPNVPDLGTPLNISSGLSGACVRTREAQYCEDTETDPRVNPEACRRLQVRSVLVAPLLIADQLVGVFEIFSPLPQAFARHDLQNLQALAQVVLESLQGQADGQVASPAATEPAPLVPNLSALLEAPIVRSESADAEETVVAKDLAAKQDWITEDAAPAWMESPPVRVEAPTAREEGRGAPVTPAQPSVPPVAKAPPPAPVVAPQVRRSELVAPVEKIPATPAQPPTPSADFLASLSPPARRDWIGSVLTAAVVALALVLGWMLGRVGWERAMGGRTQSSQPSAQPAHAAPSNAPADTDPIVVEPPGRGAPMPASGPGSSQREAPAPRQTPPQPAEKTDAATRGGLVVYQNGRIIFQQTAPAGPQHSLTGSDAGNSGANPPSGDTQEAAPVVVSSQVASAQLVQRVEPVYPEEARQRFIQGEVVLEAVVGKDGGVQELTLVSGDSQLAAAAAAAVQQWRFRPYEQHGEPVVFRTRLTVNFRLH